MTTLSSARVISITARSTSVPNHDRKIHSTPQHWQSMLPCPDSLPIWSHHHPHSPFSHIMHSCFIWKKWEPRSWLIVAIDQILRRRWHALPGEEQAKYCELARKEQQLYMHVPRLVCTG
jgi:hypothetical protein